MPEPRRPDVARAADALSGAARTARVEQLLLHGLDSYFAADYDTAIHIWTRVLFLDRGHARARAYIERARSALAERQRRSEELLHRGVAAFDRGENGDARQLLSAAVSEGVAPDVALSYLGRLDRLDPARVVPTAAPSEDAPDPPDALPAAAPRRSRARNLWFAAMAVAVIAIATGGGAALLELSGVRVTVERRTPPAATVTALDDPLPVPRVADLALDRARTLYAAGHLREALRSLEDIGRFDPASAEANRLRAEIQQLLLEASDVGIARRPAAASARRVP
jgi:hypothetical protein